MLPDVKALVGPGWFRLLYGRLWVRQGYRSARVVQEGLLLAIQGASSDHGSGRPLVFAVSGGKKIILPLKGKTIVVYKVSFI